MGYNVHALLLQGSLRAGLHKDGVEGRAEYARGQIRAALVPLYLGASIIESNPLRHWSQRRSSSVCAEKLQFNCMAGKDTRCQVLLV